ncbi:MAG TPA: hypothetical protein VGT79_10870 [Xanthomonadaceae bacterium]|nr:hypothetical protein [Xanthomonadaceae bacterium]
MKTFLLVSLLLATQPATSGEFNYAAYKESSISAAGSDLGIDPGADYWLDMGYSKFNTDAIFTGNVRPLQAVTRTLIQKWATAARAGKKTAEMYTSEIEVTQDGTNYWLPIQQALVEPLRHEVKAGTSAHFYVLLVGAHKGVRVFVVNEFNAPKA